MAEALTFLLSLDAKLGGLPDALKLLEEAQAALKKTDKATKQVDTEMEKLTATLKKLERPHKIEELKKKIEALEKPLEKTNGFFQRLVHQGMDPFIQRAKQIAEFEFIRRGVDWLIDLPKEIAHGVYELGKSILEAGAHAERSRKSFEMLFGKEQGHEMKDYAGVLYKKTEFTKGRNLQNMAELGKAGFKGKELEQAHLAALDMAALSGDKEEGLASATNALEMIRVRGEVSARALKSIGVSKDEYAATLSQRLGRGTAGSKGYIDASGAVHRPYEQLQKKIDAGEVNPEELTQALYASIMKKTGKPFLGGAGLAMGGTLEAKMTHVEELPELYSKRVGAAKGFQGISSFYDRLGQAFDPDSAAGQKIIAHLIEVVDKIAASLEKIDVNRIANLLDKLVVILGQVIDALPMAMKVGTGLKIATNPLLAGAWALKQITDPFERGNAQKPKPTSVGDLVDRFDPVDAATKTGKAVAGGTNRGVLDGAPGYVTGTKHAKDLIHGTTDELEIQSPSRVFKRLGQAVGDGFNQGIEKSTAATDDVMRGAFAAPSPRAGAAGGGRGGSVSITNSFEINVHSSGGGEHIAQDVKDQIRELLPGAMQSALETLANQAGSA